jgi:hypothetical protein
MELLKHEIITSPARCCRFDSPLVRKQDYANGYIASRTGKQIGGRCRRYFKCNCKMAMAMAMEMACRWAQQRRRKLPTCDALENVYTFVLRTVYLKRMQKVCYGEILTNYRCTRFRFELVWPTLSIGKSHVNDFAITRSTYRVAFFVRLLGCQMICNKLSTITP